MINKRILSNDICFFLLLTVIVTLPFHFLINSYLIILFSLAVICRFIIFKSISSPNFLFYSIILLFIVSTISFFKTDSYYLVFRDFEKKLSFLLFPLIFLSKNFLTERRRKICLTTFVIVIFSVSLLTYRDGIFWALNDETIQQKLVVHRPYIALYTIFSIFVLLEYMRLKGNLKPHSFFLILYFIFFLISILAKMAIITTVISLLLYLLLILWLKNKKQLIFLITSALFSSVIILYTFNPSVYKAVNKLATFEIFLWEDYNPQLVNSLNLRFLLWDCSMEIIKKDNNWLLGTGIANAQKSLNDCYSSKLGKEHFFITLSYISHNQYLTYWLDYGLFGLLAFITHLILSLICSFKNKNPLQFIFIIIIILSCITESILTVQKGIVFYGIFYSFLFISGEVKLSKKEFN